MRLPYNILSGTYTKPRIFLCEADKTRICQLDTTGTQGAFKFNSYSDISFEVARIYNDLITGITAANPFYDKIEAIRLVEVEGFGFFEIQGPELNSDGIKEGKQITAYSLEYTLSQKYLEDFYTVNGRGEWAGSLEDLWQVKHDDDENVPSIILYDDSPNPDKAASLLHLIMDKAYGWSIGHVDDDLKTMSRDFDIDRMSIYDFIMNEICQKFNCYVVFDTINMTINFYAESQVQKWTGDGETKDFIIPSAFHTIGSVTIDSYKVSNLNWTYKIDNGIGTLTFNEAPEDGAKIEATNGAMDKWETDVFITFENLSQNMTVSYDADNIKTVLTVNYGEDGTIHEVNLGLPYLTDLSYYYNVDWMGQELYDAYTAYLKETNSKQVDFTDLSQQLTDWENKKLHELNRMSLGYVIADSVNEETRGTYYIRNGVKPNYTYEEIVLNGGNYDATKTYYMTSGCNLEDGDDGNVDKLYKVLCDYMYYDFNATKKQATDHELYKQYVEKRDEALKDLRDLHEIFKFMEDYDYTVKNLANDLQSVVRPYDKKTKMMIFLEKMWNELGKTPLEQLYYDPYQQTEVNHLTDGESNKDHEYYGYYFVTLTFVDSIALAIEDRTLLIDGNDLDGIEGYQDKIDKLRTQIKEIGDSLLIDNFFKDYFNKKYPNDLNQAKESCKNALIRLSAFLREDELQLDDIVEVEIDTLDDIYKAKRDAMEAGRIELQKLCQPQLQFSMTMANIYALREFEPIIDQFQLGKVIKVALRPDYIKQSRLLQVNINFDDLSDFSCEFGDLTSLRTQSDIHADLLSQAISAGKQVATSASYWTKGSDTATSTDLKIQQGLLDAATAIKSIDGTQNVSIDKYGIKLQKKDPTTGEIDKKQGWIVNNQFLYSDDGFETTKAVFGEYKIGEQAYWGLLAEAVIAGYIEGSTIVGGQLYSSNYSNNPPTGTYFNLETGDFKIGGNRFVYNSTTNDLTLSGVTIDWNSSNPPAMTEIDGLEKYLNQLDDKIQSYSQTDDPSEEWITEDDKKKHIGDLWYDPSKGLTQRWTGSDWEPVTDGELKELAQSKAQIFTSTPTPPYSKGDLWVQGASGDIMHCVVERTKEESYDINDWEISSKYTNDDGLNDFIKGDYADDLDAIGQQIDQKAETWYQDTDPSVTWETDKIKDIHISDLWHYTGETGEVNGVPRAKNSEWSWQKIDGEYKWESMQVSDEVFNAISGKSTIYTTMPDNPQKGDLLIPDNDIPGYKAGKVYKYDGAHWGEIRYTDDTKALEALAQAKTALENAAEGISLANAAQESATNAEKNAKDYADNQDAALKTTLEGAYQQYADSKISKLDEAAAKYLGLGGKTIINDNYVISPVIEGGYLNIINTANKSRVIIDPNNLTKNNYIFQVHNGEEVTVGIEADGTASFNGHITAKSLSLGDNKISTNNISGLSSVATSGNYKDLDNKPTIPTNVTDLTGGKNILYTDNVSVSSTTTKDGITKQTITVGNNTYTSITAGDFILTNVGLGSKSSDGSTNYTYIKKDGLLEAHNAIIYGKLFANAGKIAGWDIKTYNNYKYLAAQYPGGLWSSLKTTYDMFLSIGSSSPTSAADANAKIGHDGSAYFGRYNASASDEDDQASYLYAFKVWVDGNITDTAASRQTAEITLRGKVKTGSALFDSRIYLENRKSLRGMNYKKNGNSKTNFANSQCIAYVSENNNVILGSHENSADTYVRSKNSVYLSCNGNSSNSSRYVVELTQSDILEGQTKRDRGTFRPSYSTSGNVDALTSLGSPSYKWRYVYAQYGTIQTSDRNAKKDIEFLDDNYIKAFDLLKPVSYRFLNGDRKHIGFIAQDVEEALNKIGLTSMDFGGLCKDVKTIRSEEGEDVAVLDEDGNPVYIYSLRYDEFIALNTAKIKQLEQRLEQALNVINKQQTIIEELQNKVL